MSKKKILTVIGARPQFIKAAVVSRELRKYYEEILVHTGQHYDYNMSDIFFEELDIPKPNYNLGISGGSHGKMTGEMLIELEKVMIKEAPDVVLLYGDTNSTLAGALSAVKLHIPIIHVEAGARLGTLNNPEEVNRIITDHVSTKLLYCTKSAEEFLNKEGLMDKSLLVGDPMFDAFKYYCNKIIECPENLVSLNEEEIRMPKEYYYMTCHREENTKEDNKLLEILKAMQELDKPVIYPVHPRNKAKVCELISKYRFENIYAVKPVGYLMSIFLIKNAKKIVTDSGGLQREAFFAGKQCVTIFDRVMWPETMIDNRNQISSPNKREILDKLMVQQKVNNKYLPFGDGESAVKIVKAIDNVIGEE